MTRTPSLSIVLVSLGVVLLVALVLFPIQPVLYHATRRGTLDNRTVIEERGYEIIAYANLSDRGQELYVQTLEHDGRYRVPLGADAQDFAYPTDGELGDARDYEERNALEHVVIERPPDANLPPPDERLEAAEHVRERAIERGDEDPPTLRIVGREMSRPLDRPPEDRVGRAPTVDVPPASRLQHDQRVRRWLLARKLVSDRPDLFGHLSRLDVTGYGVRRVDRNLVD